MTKKDFILIGCILLVTLIFLIMTFTKKNGSNIVITVDGKLYGSYPISEDKIISIHDTNTLVIKDGYVYMESAICPDQICVKHAKIKRIGESIICLPSKVVVSIEGNENNKLDAVVQ